MDYFPNFSALTPPLPVLPRAETGASVWPRGAVGGVAKIGLPVRGGGAGLAQFVEGVGEIVVRVRVVAAAQLPYFVWVSLASVVQLSIAFMNCSTTMRCRH